MIFHPQAGDSGERHAELRGLSATTQTVAVRWTRAGPPPSPEPWPVFDVADQPDHDQHDHHDHTEHHRDRGAVTHVAIRAQYWR